MDRCLGVRKGAWTEEEDDLLRKCIENYGERNWYRVPIIAGLNRCRKSCRLRWLNYLKPNIKRGKFAADEVDLILRLHKLLGNRWTLIAGRLPGRTANDVKNYWNTRLRQKPVISCYKDSKGTAQNAESECVNVIKPRPRTLSKNFMQIGNSTQPGYDLCKQPLDPHDTNESTSWWESFFSTGNEFYEDAGTSGASSSMSASGVFRNISENETGVDRQGFRINDLSFEDLESLISAINEKSKV